MKTREHKSTNSLLILLLNIVLLVFAVSLYSRYTALYQERLREENLGNIANLNQSAAGNATALIDSWIIKLEDVYRYAQRRGPSRDQLLEVLEDSNSSGQRQFELIGSDYTGFLARRDADGAFVPVSYQRTAYVDLQRVLDDDEGEPEGTIHFTPEFTEHSTALKHLGICVHLSLTGDDGAPARYALMLATRSSDVLAAFNSQNVFEGLSTVLVDARGNYIVSNKDFKSDNFFQYLYVYNDLSLDQRGAIQREMADKGSGEFFYQNSMEQDCVFRYAKMSANGWYCVTCVPLASFLTPTFNINYAVYAVLALLLMLGADLFWLRSMNRQLRVSMLREKEASEAKTDFLSRMSHDIRTPLNGIIGLTTLAMDEPNPPKTTEYLHSVKVSGDFLLGLVNDILDMTKVESGKMELHPEPYTCAEFCKYLEAVIAPLCLEKRMTFRIVPPAMAPDIMADRLRLNQIFFNLLSNAVKYTPEGGTVEMRWTSSELAKGRVALDFVVRDNGIGMSEDFQKHMFESFSQEHGETARQGAGLGLAIVWSLVKLMDGQISATSKIGEGSSFYVHLEADTCQESKKTVETPDGARLEGKRALLCEDNEVNALIVVKLLEKWGMQTEVAVNGRIGLEMFGNAAPGTYNVILMDIRMPEMNGLEAAHAIRLMDRPDAKSVPIIAMTANAYDTDVQNCLEAGMNAHMSKPVQPERLRRMLQEYMP